MSIISTGDLARSFHLRRHHDQVKTDLSRLTQELASGQYADTSKALNGDFSALSGIERGLRMVAAYRNAAAEAALMTSAVQSALEAVQGNLSDMAPALLAAGIVMAAVPMLGIYPILAQAYGLAERLIIEIVESEGIEKFTQVGQFIQRAQDAGCRIAVDDFGTGYSNFEYLLKLNIDIIKVDGSLVQKLETDINTRMLSEMIVGFCQRMDVQTVAEFVHSQALKNGAVAIGFDYMQGYYIGKPTPLDQL